MIFRAALLGFTGVGMGAFGAHGLKDHLSPQDLEIFKTAVFYQLVHVMAILGAVLLKQDRVAKFFFAGVLIFSGSLYTLVLTQTRWLGAITPIGGVLLLIGWGMLAWKTKQLKT